MLLEDRNRFVICPSPVPRNKAKVAANVCFSNNCNKSRDSKNPYRGFKGKSVNDEASAYLPSSPADFTECPLEVHHDRHRAGEDFFTSK